jgi:hypothetical protein
MTWCSGVWVVFGLKVPLSLLGQFVDFVDHALYEPALFVGPGNATRCQGPGAIECYSDGEV